MVRMVNINPRRKARGGKVEKPDDDAPWKNGDPTRMYGLNTPISEPLMMQLDFLVQNKAIFSKASFIRDVVSKAAEEEIKRLRRVRDAVRKLEAGDQ